MIFTAGSMSKSSSAREHIDEGDDGAMRGVDPAKGGAGSTATATEAGEEELDRREAIMDRGMAADRRATTMAVIGRSRHPHRRSLLDLSAINKCKVLYLGCSKYYLCSKLAWP
jgi:hypothetical protein